MTARNPGPHRPLRLGTRGSQLAMAQARMVQDALLRLPRPVDSELVTIETTGDRERSVPIHELGGIGAFVKELDRALEDDRIDAAVHSLKDIPTVDREGFRVAAHLPRDAPGDALVGASGLVALRPGARVGTSSLRRRAQLLRARQDLEVVPLRGNVPTRVQKVDSGALDAALLSMAGLARLGLRTRGSALDPERFPHAPGQGIVAVVTMTNSPFEGVLRPLDHGPTRAAAEMEREVLRSLGGGCLAPIGVYASVRGSEARMVAQVLSVDGRESIEADAAFLTSEAVPAAHALAERLRKSGAEALLARAATESP